MEFMYSFCPNANRSNGVTGLIFKLKEIANTAGVPLYPDHMHYDPTIYVTGDQEEFDAFEAIVKEAGIVFNKEQIA